MPLPKSSYANPAQGSQAPLSMDWVMQIRAREGFGPSVEICLQHYHHYHVFHDIFFPTPNTDYFVTLNLQVRRLASFGTWRCAFEQVANTISNMQPWKTCSVNSHGFSGIKNWASYCSLPCKCKAHYGSQFHQFTPMFTKPTYWEPREIKENAEVDKIINIGNCMFNSCSKLPEITCTSSLQCPQKYSLTEEKFSDLWRKCLLLAMTKKRFPSFSVVLRIFSSYKEGTTVVYNCHKSLQSFWG